MYLQLHDINTFINTAVNQYLILIIQTDHMKNTTHSKIVICLFAALFIIIAPKFSGAQTDKKALDKKAIKSMIGCYDVEFKYTETFAPEVDYEMAYDYTSAAFEWAELVEETEDKIVIQHLLIIQKDSSEPYIIKHWRQDWVYEDSNQYRFDKDNQWVYDPLSSGAVKGKWTQNVYQVDDSPRYSGTATWTHVDGISSWFHKADSPLPRREYSKRSDYNVMKRGNRVQILDYGWLHEQDNDKVIRTDTSDQLLVQEKGYNTYVKRSDSDCIDAHKYWQENQEMWSDVREVWDGLFDNKEDIKLHNKVEDKRLYEHLFFGTNEWDKSAVTELIDTYLIPNDKNSSKSE